LKNQRASVVRKWRTSLSKDQARLISGTRNSPPASFINEYLDTAVLSGSVPVSSPTVVALATPL
jgi:hypothetical protein